MYTISLEDENGEAITQVFDLGVIDCALVHYIGERPLLQFLNPYGDAVFNRLQAPQLAEELSRLVSVAQNETDKETLKAVQELAKRCSEEEHLYVKFYGD